MYEKVRPNLARILVIFSICVCCLLPSLVSRAALVPIGLPSLHIESAHCTIHVSLIAPRSLMTRSPDNRILQLSLGNNIREHPLYTGSASPRRRSARPRSERTVVAGPHRHRHRGRSATLPPAFPPPARGVATIGGDGDGASTSSTSSRSPELDRSRVAVAAAGLDAPAAHELELSVPSHQEHLTADGQR